MVTREKFVPVQLLERVHGELNGELSPALEVLNGKLRHGFSNPQDREGAVSRDYAELREARLIVGHLKHPDRAENAPIRLDELAWALKLAQETCRADGHNGGPALFDRAAELLGIKLAQEHALPADLQRKINNELQMLGGVDSKELEAA